MFFLKNFHDVSFLPPVSLLLFLFLSVDCFFLFFVFSCFFLREGEVICLFFYVFLFFVFFFLSFLFFCVFFLRGDRL